MKLYGAFNEDCMVGHLFEITDWVARLARTSKGEALAIQILTSFNSPPSLGALSKLAATPRASFILQTHEEQVPQTPHPLHARPLHGGLSALRLPARRQPLARHVSAMFATSPHRLPAEARQ